MSILSVKINESGYGKKIILKNIDIEIEEGKVHAFIGPNGAGKSTLLKSILKLVDFVDGKIIFNGKNITNKEVEEKVTMGISFVPQGNIVFDDLSVYENLEIGGFILKDKKLLKERIDTTLEFFPSIKDRLQQVAGTLSGGEKQQLALARALVLNPKVLLLDEPSLGLSPQLVNTVIEKIKSINNEFGTTILIVEQKVKEVLKISDQLFALRLGNLIFKDIPVNLNDDKLQEIFLQ